MDLPMNPTIRKAKVNLFKFTTRREQPIQQSKIFRIIHKIWIHHITTKTYQFPSEPNGGISSATHLRYNFPAHMRWNHIFIPIVFHFFAHFFIRPNQWAYFGYVETRVNPLSDFLIRQKGRDFPAAVGISGKIEFSS